MTLTQAAVWTKRAIYIFLLAIILGIVLKVGLDVRQKLLQPKVAVSPVEKAEMKFGTLPQISFLPSHFSATNYSYSLNTTTGELPQVPKSIKVYFIPQGKASLLGPEKARKLAESLGFKNAPDTISFDQNKFSDGERSLTVDLSTGNFHLRTTPLSLGTESATASAKNSPSSPPDQRELVQKFKNYLAAKSLLPEELGSGRDSVVLSGLPNPDKAEVSLWPSNIDDLPVVTPQFNSGLVRATYKLNEQQDYDKLDYTYWLVDKTSFSTYPLKSAVEALEDLKAGRGNISLASAGGSVSITSVYLAYLQTEQYSPYLQPVFVFEGPQFAAEVPAVSLTSK